MTIELRGSSPLYRGKDFDVRLDAIHEGDVEHTRERLRNEIITVDAHVHSFCREC